MSALKKRLEAALSSPSSVKRLDLRGSADDRLEELPKEIGTLTALEHLDVSHNALRSLPQQIEGLANLAVLDVRSNQLEAMPSFEKLKVLREVYFGRNRIVEIDKHFAWMKQLQRFEAHGNRIRYIPFGFSPPALVDVQLGDNDLSTECAPKCGFIWTAIRILLQHKKLTRLGIDSYLLQAPDDYFTAAKKLREVDVYGDDLSADQKTALKTTLPKVKFDFGLAKSDGPRLEPLEEAAKKAGKK